MAGSAANRVTRREKITKRKRLGRDSDGNARILIEYGGHLVRKCRRGHGGGGPRNFARRDSAPPWPSHAAAGRRAPTPKALAVEHIAGAVNLPLAEVEKHALEVLPDRIADIAAYCAKFT